MHPRLFACSARSAARVAARRSTMGIASGTRSPPANQDGPGVIAMISQDESQRCGSHGRRMGWHRGRRSNGGLAALAPVAERRAARGVSTVNACGWARCRDQASPRPSGPAALHPAAHRIAVVRAVGDRTVRGALRVKQRRGVRWVRGPVRGGAARDRIHACGIAGGSSLWACSSHIICSVPAQTEHGSALHSPASGWWISSPPRIAGASPTPPAAHATAWVAQVSRGQALPRITLPHVRAWNARHVLSRLSERRFKRAAIGSLGASAASGYRAWRGSVPRPLGVGTGFGRKARTRELRLRPSRSPRVQVAADGGRGRRVSP